MIRFRPLGERGFTLIEVLAALTVFTLVTIGIVPLMASAIRGAGISRTFAVGKNTAVEAMERARGFPFFIDFPTQQSYPDNTPPRRVDLLDLYFPSKTGAGYQSASQTYITVCDGTADASCPRNLPPGYSVTFTARFVRPVDSATGTETFETVDVPDGYQWNPSPYSNQDLPPSRFLELKAESTWTYGGRTRRFSTQTMLADREDSDVTLSGSGKIDYAIQVHTIYTGKFFATDNNNKQTELEAAGGFAESRIQTKSTSTADVNVRAAVLRLLEAPESGSTDTTRRELLSAQGATSILHAAPDSSPSGDSEGTIALIHPTLGNVAAAGGTATGDLEVAIGSGLPRSSGSFQFAAPAGNDRLFLAAAQPASGSNDLRLVGGGLVEVLARGGTAMRGETATETKPVLAADRHVLTSAATSFGRMNLLPTDFIGIPGVLDASSPIGDSTAVVVVDGFAASTSCRATGSESGGNAASGAMNWSATLYYFADDDANDDIPHGSYQALSIGNGAALPNLAAGNPLVFDGLLPKDDVYLFEQGNRNGYLRSLTSLSGLVPVISDGGSVVQASVNGAIRIDTAPTGSGQDDSALSIELGKVTCEAVDRR